MARAWGDAWGESWGGAWGTASAELPPPPAPSPGGGYVTRDTYHADHQHLSNMTLIATMSALLAAGVLQ